MEMCGGSSSANSTVQIPAQDIDRHLQRFFHSQGWWRVKRVDPRIQPAYTISVHELMRTPAVFRDGEQYIKGRQRLDRLLMQHVVDRRFLDTAAFFYFKEHEDLLPLHLGTLGDDGCIQHLTFDADKIISPEGKEYFLHLSRRGECWIWGYDSLDTYVTYDMVSLTLPIAR